MAPLPSPPTAPQRIDATRYVGTYSTAVLDLIVSQDGDGRIWLDQIPKGIMVEMGAQPEHTELVHYEADSLIPVQADRGMFMPHAFVGDDGHGRALYLHVGRAIRRAGTPPDSADPVRS
jgi:hypothetical protein